MPTKRIPEFFHAILWSYDLARMDAEQDARTIVVQTINYGQWRHWQWIAKTYGRPGVRRLIEETPASEFRPSALKLASLLFDVPRMKYASRSAYIRHQKALARA